MGGILNFQFWTFVGVLAGIYSISAIGLQLQFGVAGLANFGHVAFAAIGAYTMAILVVKSGLSLWLSCGLGIALAVLFAGVLGLITLRLRTDYLAITTLAFSEIVRLLAVNLQSLTGGPEGTMNLLGQGQAAYFTGQWGGIIGYLRKALAVIVGDTATANFAMLVVVWTATALVGVAVYLLVRSPWGRVLKAIREDEDAARALGKNTVLYKTQALMIGAALGALSGLFFALQLAYFSPQDFEPQLTFFTYAIIIIGGVGSIGGVPLGALIFGFIFAGTRFFNFPPFSLLESSERASLRLIIVGVLIIVLMALRPQGILGKRQELTFDK